MDSGKWWPSIESQSNAIDVMHFASFAAGVSAFVTAAISLDAIFEGHPVLGISGWALADAVAFAIVAWRIHRLSLPWSIVGLALFTLEKLFAIAHHPGMGTVVFAVVFFPYYVNAVRGALYLREARTSESARAVPAFAPYGTPRMEEGLAVANDGRTPEGSPEEHAEFLAYMKRGHRKFRQPGATAHDEFTAWLNERRTR